MPVMSYSSHPSFAVTGSNRSARRCTIHHAAPRRIVAPHFEDPTEQGYVI